MDRLMGLGLRWRLPLAVGAGLAAVIALFGFITWRAIDHTTQAALQERLSIAAITAEGIDALVGRAHGRLVAAADHPAFVGGSPQERDEQLQWLFVAIGTLSSLHLVGLDGAPLASAPPGSADGWAVTARGLLSLTTLEAPAVVPVGRLADRGRGAAYVVAPVPGPGAGPAGALVGVLHLETLGSETVPLPHTGGTGGTAIVDPRGVVVVSSLGFSQDNHGYEEEHSAMLGPLLARGEAAVTIHHPAEGADHMVAFAPLETVGGGVIAEEREDVVLAIPRELWRNLMVFGSLALVVASLTAWFHVSTLMRPIRRLALATERIASGSLDEPVRVDRSDEVGALANGFESMRRKLLEAREEQRRGEEELERRVRERTNQVRELLSKLLTAQEEERKRVARELHDEVAQDLAALLVGLRSQVGLPNGSTTSHGGTMTERAVARLEEAIRSVRTLMLDLRPSALDDLGLPAAVQSYTSERLTGTGIRLDFQAVGEPRSLGAAAEVGVFRIIQEAVSNAARHSSGRRLGVAVRFDEEAFRASVEDDGVGFDPAIGRHPSPTGSGWGVLGMYERASLLGGNLTVRSAPGAGTLVEVTVPYADGQSG